MYAIETSKQALGMKKQNVAAVYRNCGYIKQ